MLLTQVIEKTHHNSFLQVMDTYCWIHSTFSIDSRLIGEDGYDRAHPGVAPPTDLDEGQEFRYHKYYQWVCFTLFFQALLFYIPRYLWKTWEGGRVKMLVQDLHEPIIDPQAKEKKVSFVVNYFVNNRNMHTMYAIKFFVCEVLNLINVFSQIYFMDFFLGGKFTSTNNMLLPFPT